MVWTDSSRRQQFWQPDQVVSCCLQREHPAHPGQPAVVGLRHARDFLDPAIRLLDPFADGLARAITCVSCGAAVDIGSAMRRDVLRHMRRHPRSRASLTKAAVS